MNKNNRKKEKSLRDVLLPGSGKYLAMENPSVIAKIPSLQREVDKYKKSQEKVEKI